jgi:hypothetical protein
MACHDLRQRFEAADDHPPIDTLIRSGLLKVFSLPVDEAGHDRAFHSVLAALARRSQGAGQPRFFPAGQPL